MTDDAATAIVQKLEHWANGALAQMAPVRVLAARRAQGGMSSETWLIDAQAGPARVEQKWVLRIEPHGHQIYEDPSVARQFRVIRALSQQPGLPIPTALALEESPELLGAPFFLMERAHGIAPPNDYHTQGLLAEAGPSEREALWAEAVTMLARLHAVPAQADLAFLAWPGAAGEDGAGQELARWDSYRAWSGIEELSLFDAARQWLEDHRPAHVPAAFAWGDARPCNMLFETGSCTALLDWETASLGGPESDLGWWLCYDRMITQTEGVPRLPGIGDVAATIALWEQAIGRKAQYMEWHLLFATFRFALISERARMLAWRAGLLPQGQWGTANPAVRLLGSLLAELN